MILEKNLESGASFGAQVLQEFYVDVVTWAVDGFVFCRAAEICSSVNG